MASKILRLPDYSRSFKFFIVEELVFFESPFDFHYGKCSVIGKLFSRNDLWYLQNIALMCLGKEYCLKTGSIEILLLSTAYRKKAGDQTSLQNLINGSFYEVHGETVFWNTIDSSSLTISEFITQLRIQHLAVDEDFYLKEIPESSFQLDENDIKQYTEQFLETNIPAIQVRTINEIDKAEELIQSNLKLRLKK